MIFKPHDYQRAAARHVIDNPRAGLILDMGLGKTTITLTALRDLIGACAVLKPLIVAPKLVAEQTWLGEIEKWDHLKGLRLSRVIGDQKARLKALDAEADIYIISRDNIVWLVDFYKSKWPFDMLIIDEWSSFKSRASMRFKALKKVIGRTDRFIGLTGTPAPNGLLDLWPQMFLLDRGERLGTTIGGYRERYFKPDARNGSMIFSYVLKEGAKQAIYRKLEDVCISMSAKDYLKLPERLDIDVRVELANFKAYEQFKKTEILNLSEGGEITPMNAAGLYNKLLQFCNGNVYDEFGAYHKVDTSKLDAILQAYEELNGEPVLIFYQFKSDLETLKKHIPEAQQIKGKTDIENWNKKRIKCALVHGQSIGHGVNLQEGGFVIFWYGLPWSLEIYQQSVARLHRQGQERVVRNLHFITKNTVEELVLSRLLSKTSTQNELLAALKLYLF